MGENSRYRELRNRIRLSTSIDIEVNKKLNKLSADTLIPKSKLLDKAIELLLKEYYDENKEPRD